MLVAHLKGARILAALALKGPIYHCPGCGQVVTLRKGTKVAHNFAHKPPVTCAYAKGETAGHMAAKMLFLNYMLSLPRHAQVEFPVGNQRADLYVESKDGNKYVFEMQHTSITESEIAQRTAAYMQFGAAVTWLPLIDLAKRTDKTLTRTGYVIERYSPKPFERWLEGFHFGKDMWYVDPSSGFLWHGVTNDVMLEKPAAEWRESGGYLNSVGGYSYRSTRWRKLKLTGPYALAQLRITRERRQAFQSKRYSYPAGWRAVLSPRPDSVPMPLAI